MPTLHVLDEFRENHHPPENAVVRLPLTRSHVVVSQEGNAADSVAKLRKDAVKEKQQQAAPLPAAAALLWRTIDGRICMMSLQLALA